MLDKVKALFGKVFVQGIITAQIHRLLDKEGIVASPFVVEVSFAGFGLTWKIRRLQLKMINKKRFRDK